MSAVRGFSLAGEGVSRGGDKQAVNQGRACAGGEYTKGALHPRAGRTSRAKKNGPAARSFHLKSVAAYLPAQFE